MAKYLGKMHIVYGACSHAIAACWVTGNEKDAANFKRRKLNAGQRLETIERYQCDPMPTWCYQGCSRKAARHETAQRENVARNKPGDSREEPCQS